MTRIAPASDQTSTFPSVVLSKRTRPSGRASGEAGIRLVSPCTRELSWYKRRQPACRVIGLPATLNGTATLANSMSAAELGVFRVV